MDENNAKKEKKDYGTLKPCLTSDRAREIGRKGGYATAQKLKEQKAIRTILKEYLSLSASDSPQLKKMAEKMGMSDKSIKELFTIISVLNTLKTAKLDDLDKLIKLAGEENGDDDIGILKELSEYLKK